MTEKKMKIIYSMKLAGYLMQRGFRLVRTAPDRKKPLYDVYFFKDTDLLEDAIDKYMIDFAIAEGEKQ